MDYRYQGGFERAALNKVGKGKERKYQEPVTAAQSADGSDVASEIAGVAETFEAILLQARTVKSATP